MTVEVARPQPVPTEQELEHADVVAAHASPDHASAKERPPARAERGPRPGAGEAVDDEVVAALEDTHGMHGPRPLHTVDRPPIQPVVPKRDLKPGHLRVEPVGRGSEQQRRQRGRKGESQAVHPIEVGRRTGFPSFQVVSKRALEVLAREGCERRSKRDREIRDRPERQVRAACVRASEGP